MNQLDILIPFGLPPAEMAEDLLRALKMPALALLTARAKLHLHEQFDPFSRALPHETWLAREFGQEESMRKHGSPPVAVPIMRIRGLTMDAGTWFLLHPVHLHIARDHLVLTDLRQMILSEEESRALCDTAKPLFEEIGKHLVYGDARTWFIRADDWSDLRTATPDAASGHNIDVWLPQGPAERDWRKLQNEIQMHWHTHPVNEEREFRGEKPVNSVWLWGGGAPTVIRASSARYSQVSNLSEWATALADSATVTVEAGDVSGIIASLSGHGLVALNGLVEPALANDWSEWIGRFQQLESGWFAPILEAVKTGKISRVSLIMSNSTHLVGLASDKYSLKKFWVKPSLSRLVE
jgi:hypothetical protein